MAGFPHHQLDSYLAKIISAGLRAAVCEQIEDPKQAKGIVQRDVTRMVSPGTVTDDALLSPDAEQLSAGDARRQRAAPTGECGLAWIDLSTGRFEAAVVAGDKFEDELARIGPVELLVSEDAPPLPPAWSEGRMVTRRPGWAFGTEAAEAALRKHSARNRWKALALKRATGPALPAAGAVLDYLTETQKTSLGHIDQPAAVSGRELPGNRSGDASQSGDFTIAPRGSPRGFAAGSDGSYRDGDGGPTAR